MEILMRALETGLQITLTKDRMQPILARTVIQHWQHYLEQKVRLLQLDDQIFRLALFRGLLLERTFETTLHRLLLGL